MKLKQISIFIENAPGRLYEVTRALGQAGINLRALSLADVGDFGVLRLLVSNVARARRILMEKNLPARVDEVVAAEIADFPGSLAEVLRPILEAKVNVTYMYSSIGYSSGKAMVIFRFDDNERAMTILKQKGIRLLDADALGILEKEADSSAKKGGRS
ncbi:MAG TPA: amino acid-binding protein [Thermodesulfobacteriota bacterium]|nr:amino acid-binding protein [Thermodesulfobacteriota bacterium]